MAKLSVSRFKSTTEACDAYLSMVDSAAEKAQNLSGARAALYREKLQQARNPAAGATLLEAEATALGITLGEQIERVLTAAEAWGTRTHAVEIARAAAKAQIRAAEGPQEMHAIAQAFSVDL